jgi:hypothetical protein
MASQNPSTRLSLVHRLQKFLTRSRSRGSKTDPEADLTPGPVHSGLECTDEDECPQLVEEPQYSELELKILQTSNVLKDRIRAWWPRYLAGTIDFRTEYIDEEGAHYCVVEGNPGPTWDVHFSMAPAEPEECPDRIDSLPLDTEEENHSEGIAAPENSETPTSIDQEGLEPPDRSATSFAYSTVERPISYYIGRKLLIQQNLKEMTNLNCIPRLAAAELKFCAETGSQPQLATWVAEARLEGVVSVRVIKSEKGSDHLWMYDRTGAQERLKRDKKRRFLDDLARIQVAYASITSPTLGRICLRESEHALDKGLFDEMPDRTWECVSGITPTAENPAEWMQSVINANPSSSADKVAKLDFGDSSDHIPGPYPLIPPEPLLENIEVDPETGNIIGLYNSYETESVPWEVAAQCPLNLSAKSRARYQHSLKRHFWGQHLRRRVLPEPRLDQIMFHPDMDIAAQVLKSQEVGDEVEWTRWEVDMLSKLADYQERKEKKRKRVNIE